MSADEIIYDENGLSFSLPELVPPIAENGEWKLAHEWRVIFNGDLIKLPAGFSTDGASIPRFLWRVCGSPLDTPRLFAALVHDYLYRTGGTSADRKRADTIYREMQKKLGISAWKAGLEYYALRAFGGSSFNYVK
jgi:hypothetical protein